MTLSSFALVTLVQAKIYLHKDAAASLQVFAEHVGTGDDNDKTFSLDNTPIVGSVKLYVNNSLQTEVTHYTISGADITFVFAPTSPYPITASYDKAASSNTFEEYDDELLENLISAATKKAEDYTGRVFIQGTITESHTGDGTNILRLYWQPVDSITSVARAISEVLSDGDGSTTDFTLSEIPTSSSTKVYVDATLKTEGGGDDYTVSGAVITFTSAPADGVKVTVTYTHTILAISEYTAQLSKGKLIGASAWASNTIYTIVYIAGYAAGRPATQALIPDVVQAVLLILSDLYENRGDTIDSVNISGIGSASYKLPSRAEKILFRFKPLGGFI